MFILDLWGKWLIMVDKKIIIETITELLDANVDKETIYSTLQDIEVDQGDIEACYNEVVNSKKNPTPPVTQAPIIKSSDTIVSSPVMDTSTIVTEVPQKTKEEVEPVLETMSPVIEKKVDKAKSDKLNYVDINNISNSNASNKHEDELKETTLEVNDINDKHEVAIAKEEFTKPVSSIDMTEDNKIIAKQISELETKIDDIKAELTGLTKIMKDILEENRNILNKF